MFRNPPRPIFDLSAITIVIGSILSSGCSPRHDESSTSAAPSQPTSSNSTLSSSAGIRLSGSFNGWSPHDDEYLLSSPNGGSTGSPQSRLELLRYWPCGSYEFQFAVDGSMERALGQGGDGAVRAGGGKIQLKIHTSDEYTLWLDVAKNEWGFVMTPIVNPQPTILIRDPTAEIVRLFVRNCSPPAEAEFIKQDPNYFDKHAWVITPLDEQEADWIMQGKLCRPKLQIKHPGRYDLQLTVDYPRGKRVAHLITTLGGGYEVVHVRQRASATADLRPAVSQPTTDSSEQPTRLVRMADGRWGCTYYFTEEGEQSFFVRSVHTNDAQRRLTEATCIAKLGQPYLIRFDPADQVLLFQEGNCHEVMFDPRQYQLPDGLTTYEIERVELIGDFNDWQAGATPLTSIGEVYRAVVDLPDGLHHYQLLVNGSMAAPDLRANPGNDLRRPDGSTASGVFIGMPGSSFGSAKPDDINFAALRHDSTRREFFKPLGGGRVDLSMRTLEGDVQSVEVIGVDGKLIAPMVRDPGAQPPSAVSDGFDHWRARATYTGRRLIYAFRLTDGSRSCVLAPEGPVPNEILMARPFVQGG
jgi:hypothetical protein